MKRFKSSLVLLVIGGVAVIGVFGLRGEARRPHHGQTPLYRMRTIATGLSLIVMDNNDHFPKSQLGFEREVVLYKLTFWFDPKNNNGQKTFINPALLGKKLEMVKRPAETPMLAWGKPGSLWFDEKGFTYIAFADSHVKRFDKAGAAKLRWSL